LQFDGIGNYVLLPSINAGSAFSIEAWFNFEDFTALTSQITIFKDSYVNGSFGSIYMSGDDGTNFDIEWWFNSDYRLGASGPSKQTWYHFVFVSDGATVKIYIDGALRTAGDYAVSFNNDLEVGTGDGAGYWKGMVDEIRIYNRALSVSEVTAHYNGTFSNESGLLGLWHFDEGSGEIVVDSSGNGNDGVIYGASWTTWAGPSQPAVTVAQPVQAGSSVANHSPNIKFTIFPGDQVWRSTTTISYYAYDNDTDPYGLGELPISAYYSDNVGISWHELSKKNPNTGKYLFDTTQLPDGDTYMFKIEAVDNTGYTSNVMSNRFTIDNSGPSFEVSIVRASIIKEKDTITLNIVSSEGLTEPPNVFITQQGGDPQKVIMKGMGVKFTGSYTVKKGYLGTAVVSVSGKDEARNIGQKINVGRTFMVGRLGPPSPTINNLLDKESVISSEVDVKGVALLAEQVALVLNGGARLTAIPDSKGEYLFKSVKLNSAENGYNTLSITSIDKVGLQSDETNIKVKLNSPPQISLVSGLQGEKSGQFKLEWSATDFNNDKLLFSIYYSPDGGKNWDNLAEGVSEQSYEINTHGFFDGNEYRLKVIVYDGTTKNETVSDKFAIKNNISLIIANAPADYKFNITLPEFEGVIKIPESKIASLKYSFNKKDWFSVSATDGRFDSQIEKFLIKIMPPLVDGRHTLFLQAKNDIDGLVEVFKTFIVDTVPPIPPQIMSPAPDAVINSADDIDSQLGGIQIDIKGKSEAGADLELVINDRRYTAIADNNGDFIFKKVSLLNRGVNKYILSNFDVAGNVSTIDGMIISNNLLKITLLSPEKGDYISKIKEVSWSVADVESGQITYRLLYRPANGQWEVLAENFIGSSYKWDVSKYRAGAYDLKLVGNDGLSDVEVKVEGIFVDNDPPQINLDPPENTLINNTRLFFSGKTVDIFSKIAHVEYSFDGVHWYKALFKEGYRSARASFEFYNQVPLADGNYKLSVRAIDVAGNVAYAKPIELTIDTSAPVIGSGLISSGALMLFPDAGGQVQLFKDRPYKIVMSVSGDAGEVVLKIGKMNFDLVFNKSTALWESDILLRDSGEYPLEVFSKDKAGNSKSRKILNLDVIPPGYIYNKENNSRIPGAQITLSTFDKKSNSWLVWDGEEFNQRNPAKTNEAGEYKFLVPPGTYRLEVKAAGYENFKSNNIKAIKNYF
jgi:hypothetical protein